jgi:hypothetical protein
MKKTRYSESQIIKVLNEVEGGRTVNAVCRKYGIAEATYYTLSKKYPRSGYRFIPQLLCSEGWKVNRTTGPARAAAGRPWCAAGE